MRDAVIKYAIFGLKRAKQLVGNVEETKPIFEYIQKVENMRHCEDPEAAATIAAENQFTLDHVPGHLLTAQEVRSVTATYVIKLDLRSFLNYLIQNIMVGTLKNI